MAQTGPNNPMMDAAALRHMLDHAAHYLPMQGPIGVFIHHNTLHAFQHLPFEEAVLEAARLFGTEPYMAEATYKQDLQRGRIQEADVMAVLTTEPEMEVIPGRVGRRGLRQAMLIPGLRPIRGQRVEWLMNEGGWLRSFRGDLGTDARTALGQEDPRALWEVCVSRTRRLVPEAPTEHVRPHDAVMAAKRIDLDALMHPTLIGLLSAFVDQGVAQWPMPLRNEGLLVAARHMFTQRSAPLPAALNGLADLFRDQAERGLSAEDTVLEALVKLGVDAEHSEAFITAELLALPGWAGLVRKLEMEPALAPHEPVHASLMDYMAVRLTLVKAALRNMLGYSRAWRSLGSPATALHPLERELRLFDVAQLLGLSATDLSALDQPAFDRLCSEIDVFDDLERRRVWHLAYERRHERQILLPMAAHRRLPPLMPKPDRYAAEVFFCIDEREESIRRALEEADPEIRTYGAAGFFGCAVSYSGMDDRTSVDLCPVVVKPAHSVQERPHADHAPVAEKRQRLRRAWAQLVHGHTLASRQLFMGWLSNAFTGVLALFPLVVRLVRPLAWARMSERLSERLLPEPMTELDFHRSTSGAEHRPSVLLKGFTTAEMADRVGGTLATVGLTKNAARLVVVLGHGSTSLNNPHESAHDCGACGGRRGGPNGRLFAAMANVPEVRDLLRERGIGIPEDTWFLGGYHDTCNDDIDLFDLEQVPIAHQDDLRRVRTSLDAARAMSAHERSRRFEAAGADIDAGEGLRHVQERAEHLAEPRPEYGHCTNAVCIVGRRDSTRGLFFDRRAFLVSYDPHNDPDNAALGRVLGAVIPVCGGISLEYYFSFVDNEGYGCGTKLPHNVTGLIGVMNGYQGDLRTGLPWQMVEIHEPVRILFVIETTPDRLMPLIMANPELKEFVVNRWIRLATQDPDSGAIMVYRNGVFEPIEGDEVPLPRSTSSARYYQGTQEHLPVARIEPAMTGVR